MAETPNQRHDRPQGKRFQRQLTSHQRRVPLTVLLASYVPNVSFFFLLAGVVLSPFDSIRVRGSMAVGDVFILLSAAPLALDALKGRTFLWLPWWLAIAGAAIAFSAAAHGLADGITSHDDHVYAAILGYALILIPIIVASQRITHPKQLELLLRIWVAGNLLGAVVAIMQHNGVSLGPLNKFLWHIGPRVAGFNLHPNTLGAFEALTAPVCLALALSARNWLRFAFWASSVAIAIYVTDLTGSRAALASGVAGCVAAVMLFVVFQRRSEMVRRYLRALLMALAIVVAFQMRDSGPEGAFNRFFGDSSLTAAVSDIERAQLFNQAVTAFWQYTIAGEGYDHIIWAHNSLLGMLSAGGLLGLSAYVLRELGAIAYVVFLLWLGIKSRCNFGVAVGLSCLYLSWLLLGVKQMPLLDREAHLAVGMIVLFVLDARARSTRADRVPDALDQLAPATESG